MKSFRDIRVIPVVLVAIFGLAVLKVAGLVIDGGYVFDYQPQRTSEIKPPPEPQPASRPQPAKKSWAQDMLNFPGGPKVAKADSDDITGSVPDKPKEAPKPAAPTAADPPQQSGTVVFPEPNQQSVSPSERAILERLQARRQELEQRAREVEIRESLLKSAEKRIEGRVEEMKATEARITTATGQKAETDAARFKGIITMYEGMKPKDAAKVFDRLEMSVLYEIASQIAPRKMSDILGLMQPEAAERLTVELARRAGTDKSASTADLPKIEGKILPQKLN
jgi:flagellar motility protein MotE (MotC chaperone)